MCSGAQSILSAHQRVVYNIPCFVMHQFLPHRPALLLSVMLLLLDFLQHWRNFHHYYQEVFQSQVLEFHHINLQDDVIQDQNTGGYSSSFDPSRINSADIAVSAMVCWLLPNHRNSKFQVTYCSWSYDADTRCMSCIAGTQCMSCIPCVAPQLYPGHQISYQNKHGKHTYMKLVTGFLLGIMVYLLQMWQNISGLFLQSCGGIHFIHL